MRGKYIVIEGSDGTGKSTQVERLAVRLEGLGIRTIQVHEPGGVPTAEALRSVIKDGTLERDAWTNVLLFTASRRLNWLQMMQPALAQGTWVLAARSWISTVVYQGYGEGVAIQKIIEFTDEHVSPAYRRPDLSVILSLADHAARHARIDRRGKPDKLDTFESKNRDFQDKLQSGYEQFAADNALPLIDASVDIEALEAAIWHHVQPLVAG